MIFSNTYKNSVMAREVTDSFQTLAEWLGLSADEINVSGEKALKEITVFTCIKILSETVSKLPLKIYQDREGKKKASDHYLYNLLKLRPNPYMSASDFWKCVETQRNIHGNAYVWLDTSRKGRNAGKVVGLYPLSSEKVKIYVDDKGLLSSNEGVWYVYTDNLGIEHRINSAEILHFKGVTTDGIVGRSPIETLKNTIESAKSASLFLNNSYKNGMQTAGIIQYVGDLDVKAENKFREKFEQMSSGLKNANRISLLPIGYQFQPIALKLTDAQFLENTRLTLQQITAAFGIKPHQINDQSKTSYASTAESNREFYTDTLLSILTMYEQELTYKLFLDAEISEGFYVKFNADVIMRVDIKTRYEAYSKAIQNGFKTPNEVRALEEDEEKEGGDLLYFNGNMIPIAQAGNQYKGGGNGE